MSEESVEVPTAESANEQAATEAASIAAVGAVVASETASEARNTAESAIETAEQAGALAVAAAESAQETREAVNASVAEVASGTVSRQEFETFRQEMEPLFKFHADMEAARVAREQSENEVQEVSVENGVGSQSAGSTGSVGNSDSGSDSGSDGSGSNTGSNTRRRGLRHRKSRKA